MIASGSAKKANTVSTAKKTSKGSNKLVRNQNGEGSAMRRYVSDVMSMWQITSSSEHAQISGRSTATSLWEKLTGVVQPAQASLHLEMTRLRGVPSPMPDQCLTQHSWLSGIK